MATQVLTPNNPHPVTGLRVPFIGWHFIGNDVPDVLFGCNLIWVRSGYLWYPEIKPILGVVTLPPPWQISFTKLEGANEQVVVVDRQWFGYDPPFIRVIDEDNVANNYTLADWNPSA